MLNAAGRWVLAGSSDVQIRESTTDASMFDTGIAYAHAVIPMNLVAAHRRPPRACWRRGRYRIATSYQPRPVRLNSRSTRNPTQTSGVQPEDPLGDAPGPFSLPVHHPQIVNPLQA